MGRKLIHLMTAAAVLWHTVVGCCAHHAHAAELRGHEHVKAHAGCKNSHHCGHHRHAHSNATGDTEPTQGSCPCERSGRCSDPKCAFDIVKPTVLPDLDAQVAALCLPVELTFRSDVDIAASFLDDLPTSGWPPSLRTHLFLSVLLN